MKAWRWVKMTTEIDKNIEKEDKKDERRWTSEQASAIDTRDKTLLVSAAAGSGKTAVLTERIIKTLTEGKNPPSVTELLVVTFTKTAAAEMRERIGKAIKKAAEADVLNTHLQHQLMLLPSAKIRTIDSFCNDILKSNTDKVGISPDYRIGDEAEQQLLAFSVLEGMINSIYDGELTDVCTAEQFEDLADCLTDSKKMGKLSEVFYSLYMDVSCAIEGAGLIRKLSENFNPDSFTRPDDTIYGKHFKRRLDELCDHYVKLYEAIIAELLDGEKIEQDYIPVFRDEIVRLEMLKAADSFERINEILSVKSKSLPPKAKGTEHTDLQAYASKCKKKCSEDIAGIKGIFTVSVDDWRRLYDGLYARLLTLSSFMERFDDLYMGLKRQRCMYGYHDIERFAYRCLWQNGEKTEAAHALANEFKAVYIDEYQDVNALQNKIFEALSREDNRFMVGDIKQSIYSFRSAEPEIFASMKRSFPELENIADSAAASVFMSANFRCDEGVVRFVNGIFDKMFSVFAEGIGYTDSDKLVFAKDRIPGIKLGTAVPKIIIGKDPGTSAEDDDRSAVLPEIVAERVRDLIDNATLNDGSPVRARDIAVIMRSVKGRASHYADALREVGVASRVEDEKNFFLNSEVLLALCLLNSIDNPRRDIYLAGLLRSPLFDFTADELYLISNSSARASLYERLLDYNAKNPDFEKGRLFVKKLCEYRDIAEGIGADELLYRLYHETGLLALAAKNGGKDNLEVLYSYARSFEASSYRGLFAFISFINTVVDRRSKFAAAKESAPQDEVSIMTAHKSKGLEFPIVFFVDAQKMLQNSGGESSRIKLSSKLGITFRLRTPSGLALVENPPHTANGECLREARLEEELRILYVALTRAREKLFVVGSAKNDIDEYIQTMRDKGELLTLHSARKLQTSLDIIIATRPEAEIEAIDNTADNFAEDEGENESGESGQKEAVDVYELPKNARCVKLVGKEGYLERFHYKYPLDELSRVPGKMSVSRLYPTVLDGADEPHTVLFDDDGRKTLPSFILENRADESAKRGIATHLFMQFCNLEAAVLNGAQSELCRLVDEGFMSEKERDLVRLDEIEAFVGSPLFKKMRAAKKLYRELRFNVNLPASLFSADEERREALSNGLVLVQGVIDCIIEDENGDITLIDYKTDRLTKAELSDPSLAREKLYNKHYQQLYYYSLAIERIFARKPLGAQVYSLPLGDTVQII